MGEAPVRVPKQKRSMRKKQLIIDTAKMLFCKNGYHNTTTNEISKQAGISIGTLYSYFEDKYTILLELLKQYNIRFYQAFDFIDMKESMRIFQDDLRRWLYYLIDNLILVYQQEKDFYCELEALSHSIPEVAAVLDAQDERVRIATFEIIKQHQKDMDFDDVEAASIIVADVAGAIVDRIIFKKNIVNYRRIIDTGVDILYKILTK